MYPRATHLFYNNASQLSHAIETGDIQLAKQLVLEKGINPAEILSSGKSIFEPFYWLTILDPDKNNTDSQQVILFLIEQGALDNPANFSRIKHVIYHDIDKNQLRPGEIRILQAIIQLANSHNENTLPVNLKRLAIYCATLLTCTSTIENTVNLPCLQEKQCIDQIRLNTLFISTQSKIIYEDQITFHTTNPELKSVFLSIATLLENTALCLHLLKTLEQQITDQLKGQQIDLSHYLDDSNGFVFANLPWPIPPSEIAHCQTNSLLNTLLLEKEQFYGINQSLDAPITFVDFIADEVATKYIANGNLFNEFSYAGNLLHGKFSHRLQWHIIMLAHEQHLLNTRGFSILELLQNCTPVWTFLFDRYEPISEQNNTPPTVGFCSPWFLHSTLLSTPDPLPNLSALCRKTFFRSLSLSETPFIQKCAEHDAAGGGFYTSNELSQTIENYCQQKNRRIRTLYHDKHHAMIFSKNKDRQEKQLSTANRSRPLSPPLKRSYKF